MLGILALVLSTIIFFRSADLSPVATNPEAEYYRGAFDVCMWQMKQVDTCLDAVRRIKQSDWYAQPSHEWRWPVEAMGKVG
jgi:hypothetical protein